MNERTVQLMNEWQNEWVIEWNAMNFLAVFAIQKQT